LDYWKGKLKGAVPLELPTDRPRRGVHGDNRSTTSLLLSPALRDQLTALSERESVTLFITLLAAFNVLLSRHTGQEDVVVGTPMPEPSRRDIEGLSGFPTNILAMRNDLSGNPSFQELLRRVQETALGAYANQDLPFEKLVEQLEPQHDSHRSPIFQVLFSRLNPPEPEAARAAGVAGASNVDLGLYAVPVPEGIQCTWDYDTDLFDAGRMQRMARHLEVLLEAVVRDPGQQLSEITMLTSAERHELLVEWNRTQTDFPRHLTLHELFEAQAQRTPEAVAVEFAGRQLRYRELNERANQLAHRLMELGVGPDVLVGLLHERSEDMLVALLGILKAGGAYVPLDPSFPEDRLSYMVENSGMRVLVTQSGLDSLLPKRPESVVRLDSDWNEIAKHNADRPAGPGATASNLAYVLYTSGSTGKPKGVEIEHSAIVNLLLSMQHEPGFTAADTLLAVTTLSFDIAGLELYLPLICGGRVVIASHEDTHDPHRLIERIEESRCTVMQATPATWRALIHAGWSGSPKLKVLCGGEAFPQELAEELLARCAELWNMYGPTETTVWSTLCRIPSSSGGISIGRPIANTQVFVLDANRSLVPVGVNGELYIGGAGVARGYLKREDLTRERIVESPFEPNARLYRTGDLAQWLPDGRLECLGRVDTQVKIRGFRVELGEIEAILNSHPAVRQGAVIAAEDSSGQKNLVAYYETHEDTQPAISDLREHLRNKLPDYMIPSSWVALPALPLTPNRKVDRKALPALDEQQRAQPGTVRVSPRNDTERALAKIWGEVLEVSDLGIYDNFFELGGHSLRAVNLVGEVERQLGLRLPLDSLINAPTIAQFAEIVQREESMRGKSGEYPDRETIAHQVREFVVANYLDGQDRGLGDEDSFLEREIIDPLRLHELVEFLERSYGVVMDAGSLIDTNVGSVQSISRFVQHTLSAEARSKAEMTAAPIPKASRGRMDEYSQGAV
jgi:amino acid adenylation domain-containing protein